MENLIPIRNSNDKFKVSARDLRESLGVARQYKEWWKDQVESIGLIKDEEFYTFTYKSPKNNRLLEDAMLSLDCAKEVAAVSKTAKGKLLRKYFIECEKKLQEVDPSAAQNLIMQLQLEEHTRREVQIHNSKLINAKKWDEGGKGAIIKYNTKSCELHLGMKPKEVKAIGKQAGLKSKQCSSSKEVARHLMPGKACAMSFTDRVITNNDHLSLERVAEFSKNKLAPVFDDMLEMGIRPAELEDHQKQVEAS